MTDQPPPLTDEELNRYVDDRLGDDRRAEVETLLAADGNARSTADAYRAQNAALHGLFDGVLEEPVPAALARTLQGRRGFTIAPLAAAAAAVALLMIGGGVGWFARDSLAPASSGPMVIASTEVAEWALTAHALYSPEVRHPVEVVAADEAHLVAWLTNRLGAEVRAPRLAPLGYSLIGGRLLPSPGGPAAQFMYEDDTGSRLTLYVSSGRHENQETAFRFVQDGAVNAFYWIDGPFGYALVGEIDKDDLRRSARLVYEQLTP